jgi:hypothetical protein
VSRLPDPVYEHARREALIILSAWLASTVYCCAYSYFFGYTSPARPLGVEDVRTIFGMPSWVFWGIMVPWGVCSIFTFAFAGWYMADDDLGSDHAAELETDIREGAGHEY